jgi:ATP/ADP translocase
MLKNGMIIASIILPIVGIVAGVMFLLDANPEKKAAGKLWLIIGIVFAVIWAVILGE